MGRTPLRNSHPFAAQRQHLWPNASSLRAKHDGVVRAKREAWQRRRPLVGHCSHLPARQRGEELLGILYPFELHAEERPCGDGLDLSGSTLAVAGTDEPVGIMNVATLDAENF
jgi:hypothetical protein